MECDSFFCLLELKLCAVDFYLFIYLFIFSLSLSLSHVKAGEGIRSWSWVCGGVRLQDCLLFLTRETKSIVQTSLAAFKMFLGRLLSVLWRWPELIDRILFLLVAISLFPGLWIWLINLSERD